MDEGLIMALRSYGEIDNVQFVRQGFDIYTNGIKYRLLGYNVSKYVSINTMKELKQEISNFNKEENK